VKDIKKGQPLSDDIREGEFRYYVFYNSRKDSKILVSLTPLDEGDVDLYVGFGRDERPTLDKYLVHSAQLKSDSVQIYRNMSSEAETLFAKNSMQGFFVIGVYGVTNCLFKLTWIYEDALIV
jgi:hypothetical protein